MTPYLFRITEENKFSLNRPHESNRIYYSELNKWDTHNAFRSFSLKYILDGVIRYEVDQQRYDVSGDHFLLANKREEVAAHFQSESLTRSICIDINTDIISEAATVMAAKEDFDFENYLAHYFKDSVLCARIYSVKDSPLGTKLAELASLISKGEESALNHEWFLAITELIILQEKGNSLALNGIKSVKASTRIETLDRLNKAKAYMDELFLQNPEMSDVARFCAMSEFHFYRCFKQAFSITPYRYLLNKRLEHSQLLLEKKLLVSEIAKACGFSDIFTFSKAFKKAYKVSPTHWLGRRNSVPSIRIGDPDS